MQTKGTRKSIQEIIYEVIDIEEEEEYICVVCERAVIYTDPETGECETCIADKLTTETYDPLS